MFEIVGVIAAVFILVAIAFPKLMRPELKEKEQSVGSTYWGIYEGAKREELEGESVRIPKPSRALHPVAGSISYARGPAGSSKK